MASSALMASNRSIQILRGIISEIRKSNTNLYPKETPIIQFILAEYKKNQITDKKLCRGEEELKFLAQTYLCYVTSHRKYQELYDEYHGKGERSITESANLVGLRLPKVFDDETRDREKDK